MRSAMAGTTAVSPSRAGRIRPGLVSSAEFREPPREYAMRGVLAGNPDGGRVDVDMAEMTAGRAAPSKFTARIHLATPVIPG